MVSDTTVKKVDSHHSPHGSMGQKYLVSGKNAALRLWQEDPNNSKQGTLREYETLGYVLEGKAELYIEDQKIILTRGDSWLVPQGAEHRYVILEAFKAVEATSPPGHIHQRDE